MTEVNINQGESISITGAEEEQFLRDICANYALSMDNYNTANKTFAFPATIVGYIQFSDRIIYINPRFKDFTLTEIFIMKLMTYDLQSENHYLENYRDLLKYKNNIPLLSQLYIKELKRVIKIGLPHEFVKSEIETNWFKGKVDIPKTILNLRKKKANPVHAIHESLRSNLLINYLFYLALTKVKEHIDRFDYLYLFTNLNGRYNFKISDLNKVEVKRNFVYAKKCIEFARMILNDLTPFNFSGGKTGEAFLINFDRLFENFIAKILVKSELGYLFEKPSAEVVYGQYFLGSNYFQKGVLPDIWFNKSINIDKVECTGIIDVKNKYPEIFSNPDIFQILYYCGKFNSKNAVIVYPHTKTQASIRMKFTEESEVTLHSVFFNIKTIANGNFDQERLRFSQEVASLVT